MKNRNSRLKEKCGLDSQGFVLLSKKKKKEFYSLRNKETEVSMYKTKYHDQITCFIIVKI